MDQTLRARALETATCGQDCGNTPASERKGRMGRMDAMTNDEGRCAR